MGAPPTTTCRNTHLLHIALAKGVRTKSGTSPHLCGQKRNQLIKFAHTSIRHNRIIGCRFAEHSSAQNKIDVAASFDRSHSRTPTEWFKSMVSMINSYAHKYIVSQILHLSTVFLQTDAMFSFFLRFCAYPFLIAIPAWILPTRKHASGIKIRHIRT